MTTIQVMAETFTNTTEAFEYFISEIYPNLEPSQIKKIKNYVYYFRSGVQGISENKMQEIMKEYSNVKIEKSIKLTFE